MVVWCIYCNLPVAIYNSLQCQQCEGFVHFSCLEQEKPNRFEGDILFEFECKNCGGDEGESVARTKITWLQAIHIALYNLSIRESGRQGFFRWKDDICSFISQNWNILFPEKPMTNNWRSTVAGTLSVYCSKLFKSGQSLFNEAGWWALMEVKPPPKSYGDEIKSKQKGKQKNLAKKLDGDLDEDVYNMGRGKRKQKQNQVTIKRVKVEEEKIKEEELDYNEFGEGLLSSVGLPDGLTSNDFNSNQDDIEGLIPSGDPFSLMKVEDIGKELSEGLMEGQRTTVASNEAQPDTPDMLKSEDISNASLNEDSQNLNQEEFKTKSQIQRAVSISQPKLTPMNFIQEREFFNKLNCCPNAIAQDPVAKRLQRKLKLRKLKTDIGLPLFDVDHLVRRMIKRSATSSVDITFTDSSGRELTKAVNEAVSQNSNQCNSFHHPALQGINVLDRFRTSFRTAPKSNSSCQVTQTFISRLVGGKGSTSTRSIGSPYTQRVLKPFIRRDFDTKPLKLKLMEELIAYTHRFDQHWITPCPSPIDYCYVQPHHIPAVNAMCEEFFWAGINLSECLQYPDFSCIVLYRKLVIGFAFMVPDVKYNEAYISFLLVHPDWRNAGIGTFMIYHLIQTCMGKDVTLHVSASNPSMMLYQKFGFKAEEFILDFYDKYLPEDSKECKHAFFLRLQR